MACLQRTPHFRDDAHSAPPIGIDKAPFAPYTDADMLWIGPSENGVTHGALVKRPRAASDQLRPDGGLFRRHLPKLPE